MMCGLPPSRDKLTVMVGGRSPNALFRLIASFARLSGDNYTTFANSFEDFMLNAYSMAAAVCERRGMALTARNMEVCHHTHGLGAAFSGDDHVRGLDDPTLGPAIDRWMRTVNMKLTTGPVWPIEKAHMIGFLSGHCIRGLVDDRPSAVLVPKFHRWASSIGWSLDWDGPAEHWRAQVRIGQSRLVGRLVPFQCFLDRMEVETKRLATNQRRVPNISKRKLKQCRRQLTLDADEWIKPQKALSGQFTPTFESLQQLADVLSRGSVSRLLHVSEVLRRAFFACPTLPAMVRLPETDWLLANSEGRADAEIVAGSC